MSANWNELFTVDNETSKVRYSKNPTTLLVHLKLAIVHFKLI